MEELIKRLERVIQTGAPDKDGQHPISAEAVLEVVKELSEHGTNLAEVGTDCISRRQAIETFKDCAVNGVGIDGIVDALKQLPSAQPEIIRCTECKHYREYDSKYVENAVVVQCMADRYPISETIPDGWFCAGAERKDDE